MSKGSMLNSKVTLQFCFPTFLTPYFPYILTTKYCEEIESYKICETYLYSVKSFGRALVELEVLEIETVVTLA